MPLAMEYAPPGTATRNLLIQHRDLELRDRTTEFDASWAYYNGTQKSHLKLRDNEPNDNVTLNLVRMATDREVSFLFPEMPELEVGPPESEENEDEKWLREAWELNGGLRFCIDMGMNGSLGGHPFVRLRKPLRPGDPPRLININPRQVTAFWRADDISTVLWYELSWNIGTHQYIIDFINNRAGRPLDTDAYATSFNQLYRGEEMAGHLPVEESPSSRAPSTWSIVQYERPGNDWAEVGRDEWNFPVPPIFDFQHMPNPNSYYGKASTSKSDRELQDSVNLMTSIMARINRFHASPRTIAVGIDRNDITPTAIDHMWAIENSDAKIQNLEMVSQLEAAQGLTLMLYDTYLAQQRTVILRGEVKDFQRVTNTGVRTVFLDQLAKNKLLRDQYGAVIADISFAMQVLAGRNPQKVTVNHRDPLPQDDAESVEIGLAEIEAKTLSRETYAVERGRNWLSEKEKMKTENEDELFNPPIPETGQEEPDLTQN